MTAIKQKTHVTLKLEATCPTHSRTDVTTRDVETTIDEPTERGGTNLAPSPLETVMAALLGCSNTITHKIAAKHGIAIDAMSMRLNAVLDRRGVILQEEIDLPFPEVELIIDLKTGASDAEVDLLKTELPKFCAVSKVLRQSGTKITEIWNVTRP